MFILGGRTIYILEFVFFAPSPKYTHEPFMRTKNQFGPPKVDEQKSKN